MKSLKMFVFLIFFLSCCSCVSDMTLIQFNQRINDNMLKDFNGIYYIGSKDSYDYFIHTTGMYPWSNKRIKNSEGKIIVPYRFFLTNDSKKWICIKTNTQIWRENHAIDATEDALILR